MREVLSVCADAGVLIQLIGGIGDAFCRLLCDLSVAYVVVGVCVCRVIQQGSCQLASMVVGEAVVVADSLVRVAGIACLRTCECIIRITPLCHEAILAHIVHACEQVALLLIALCQHDSVGHAEYLQQIAPRQVVIAERALDLFMHEARCRYASIRAVALRHSEHAVAFLLQLIARAARATSGRYARAVWRAFLLNTEHMGQLPNAKLYYHAQYEKSTGKALFN